MDTNLSLTLDQLQQLNPTNTININIGVLGHIDSGKTSLVRTLSRITSTASLDKNPQSQERGITLDLGFSAFYTRIPQGKSNKEFFQFTLVDCPGHASLIKTIIGGAQIIDLMFLVIDVNKGIQTQTAECIVIGEILANKLIIILNKIDLSTKEQVDKSISQLRKVFNKTKFTGDIPIIPVSAANNINMDILLQTLIDYVDIPQRTIDAQKGLLFMIDHCFMIKGQGTVTTGTILQGTLKSGDEVYFPMLKISKKVKSLQMFKRPVEQCGPGDRVGALFTNLEAKDIERGIVCKPGVVQNLQNIIITLHRVSYYKSAIKSLNKFHITSGHITVMGQLRLFVRPQNLNLEQNSEGEYIEDLDMFDKMRDKYNLFAVISLEKPLMASEHSLVIASKLDTDLEANICRIAFYGNIIFNQNDNQIFQEGNLRVFRRKTKIGKIEKVIDNYTVLVKDLFKKETNVNAFLGKTMILKQTGNQGKIEGAFGKSGKIRVFFDKGVQFNLKEGDEIVIGSDMVLVYKKYLFNK